MTAYEVFTDTDREALELALRLERARNAERIEGMLKDRPWSEVATFAAFSCQMDFLGLPPYRSPPMYGDLPSPIDEGARRLLERMLALGISRYHPDPERAIAAAEARARGNDLPPAPGGPHLRV